MLENFSIMFKRSIFSTRNLIGNKSTKVVRKERVKQVFRGDNSIFFRHSLQYNLFLSIILKRIDQWILRYYMLMESKCLV